MKNEFRAFISNFPFLNADETEIIVENTLLREFRKESTLLKAGNISKECYAVIRGCKRILHKRWIGKNHYIFYRRSICQFFFKLY